MPNGFPLKNCLNIILITSMFEGGYSFHVDINYIVCLRTNQAGKNMWDIYKWYGHEIKLCKDIEETHLIPKKQNNPEQSLAIVVSHNPSSNVRWY